jgi:hypothetical protein
MDKEQCPWTKGHVAHHWRFDDEDESVMHYCYGHIRVHVDVIERPVDAD